jgi:hypothetical protein
MFAVLVFAAVSPAQLPRDGLVAHWAGDGDAKDSAGTNHGTIVGDVAFAPGVSGQAFKFSGKAGHYITLGDAASLRLTGDQTLAMWICPDELPIWGEVLGTTPSAEGRIALNKKEGIVYFCGTQGERVSVASNGKAAHQVGQDWPAHDSRGPGAAIRAGQWTHVAIVRDMKAKLLRLYINGVLATETGIPVATIGNSGSTWHLGGHLPTLPDDVPSMAGLIDEVAIWNRPLTAAEALALARADEQSAASPMPEGLLAHWPAEGDAKDVLGKHHGNLSEGAGFAPGHDGRAFEFDGRKGHIALATTDLLAGREAFTVAGWVRYDREEGTTASASVLLMQGGWCDDAAADRQGRSFWMEISARSRRLVAAAQGGTGYITSPFNTITSGGPFARGQWHHVAVVFNGGEMALYIDGQRDPARTEYFDNAGSRRQAVPKSLFRTLAVTKDRIHVGCGYTYEHERAGRTWAHFSGLIDDLAVWNRALDAEEVRCVFEAPCLHDALRNVAGPAAPTVVRIAEADRIAFADGQVLTGTIENERFELTTSFGKLDLRAGAVVGLARAKEDDRVWIVLDDGQVVAGALAEKTIRLKLSTGATLSIPLSSIQQCGWRSGGASPPATQPAQIIELRSGERLRLTSLREKMQLHTPYGRLDLSPDTLVRLTLARTASRHRAELVNGTIVTGELLPEKLTGNLALGLEAAVERRQVLRLTGLATRGTPSTQAVLTTRGGDRLIGQVAVERLTVRTAYGEAPVPPESMPSFIFDPAEAGKVAATQWDNNVLKGTLAEKEVPFELSAGGARLAVPAEQIVAITRDVVVPPPDAVKRIERLIALLGADAFAERERAQSELEAMGPRIVPVLRRYRNAADPEVAQRVEQILKKLGAGG